MKIEAAPLRDDLAYGSRVQGLTEEDLRDTGIRQQLRELFRERGLIVFEDVEPTSRMQLAISGVFGPLKDYSANARNSVGLDAAHGLFEMGREPSKSNIVEIDGERFSGWLPWHFDQCYKSKPNRARVLRCARVSAEGGLTGFLDGIELFTAISPGIRKQIEDKSVVYTMDMHLGRMRFGVPDTFRVLQVDCSLDEDLRRGPTLPCAIHPAVWTRPSGQNVLHVSPWMATGIDGQEDARGGELLEAVSQEICRLGKSIAYFHRWRPEDMLIWDNLRMVHSASGYDPAFQRIMYRSTIVDDGCMDPCDDDDRAGALPDTFRGP